MKQGFLLPVYRHGKTVYPLVKQLAVFGLPVIVVDDGNDSENRLCLKECASQTPGVVLVSLKKNLGKGGAVMHGLKRAEELGLTHVLQIDADGQHDIGNASFFLEESARHPENVICGYPEFDETAPKGRVTGRKISSFWAAVTSLSLEFKDVLCGFRVYPVNPAVRICRRAFLDKRMGFDPEILVRLYWNKVYPVYHPIRVRYPEGGISNFHIVKDNIRVSWTFCRLSAGMLLRLPLLIARKTRKRYDDGNPGK